MCYYNVTYFIIIIIILYIFQQIVRTISIYPYQHIIWIYGLKRDLQSLSTHHMDAQICYHI